jgi:hypothetical protein
MNNLNDVLNLALENDKKTFEFSKMNVDATLKSINKINDIFDIINKHLSEMNKLCLNLKNRVDALEKNITQ